VQLHEHKEALDREVADLEKQRSEMEAARTE
jgi:hypothetical protein